MTRADSNPNLHSDLYGEDAVDWADHDGASTLIEPLQLMLPPPRSYKPEHMHASVVAPCTHDGLCPLKNGAWCNFSQRVHSGVIRKVGAQTDLQTHYPYLVLILLSNYV